MPFRYERDDGRRLVTVTVEGEFQASEALAVLKRHRDEDVGSFGILYDLLAMTGQPTVADLRRFLDEKSPPGSGDRPRGPVAIFVTDPNVHRMACAYAVLAASTLTIEVFTDRADAERWLTAHAYPPS